MNDIIQAGQRGIEAKLDDISAVEWRGGELYIPKSAMVPMGKDWNTTQQDIDKVIKRIKYYEMKEGTTLFELAMWKARLDQVDETTSFGREAFRVNVPGPVKDTIMQYL